MKKIIYLIFLSLLLLSGNQAIAEDSYVTIRPAVLTQTGDNIEVLEIFWYGCPHCYDFEPYLKRWLTKKPEDVTFRRMPGILGESWIPHAKAYYTAEKLGIVDKIHTPLFDAIHKEKRNIYNEATIKKFFVEQGVDADEFTKIYDSEEINTKVKQAFVMGTKYKVTGVPTIIVNGKYMTSPSHAGGLNNALKITDFLIEKERASK